MPRLPANAPAAIFGFLAGAVVTVPLAFVALAQGGVGHGSYTIAIVAFPYAMVLAALFDKITWPLMVLALAQFPAYGVALGLKTDRPRARARTALVLAVAHVVAIGAVFAFA